ncbi:two-component hybrid sensor and regulator [Labilithrix luteola]|uniref:histidine kinase n=1 Tax=Labilithrix luteola TaxID=1391654 RepID=A0A0K1PZ55_9BACT|nr:ATP-binding protein [Labilithrix luteola]AKU98767.1 two-component hybrid sensor and regulator [Labilithrix luteola]
MTVRRLSTKYLLASAVLVLSTVACGVFGVYTFARLGIVVAGTLNDSQATLDLTTRAGTLLEREDDELLRAMVDRSADDVASLDSQRHQFDSVSGELGSILVGAEELEAGRRLRSYVDAYRVATDELLRAADPPTALARYHKSVNPLLRKAVAECGAIREVNFREMQHAGERARDEAFRATFIVAGVGLIALVVSLAVARHLTQTVVKPVLALTGSVEAIARGEFGSRVTVASEDELGRLASGFNRMAEALDEFRRSNLGEVLRAKNNLEATLEALPDAVVVVKPDGGVDAMNRPARALLDRSNQDEPPGTWKSLGLPEPASRELVQALEGGTERPRADLTHAFAAGPDTALRFLPLARPVAAPDAGGHGAVLVLYDVTEFARLDELRSEVVAVASHELKTPLTSIRMNLLLLGETATGLPQKQREMLETALQGCEELATLTERFLDVTRIEAGQLQLSLEPTDLRHVIEPIAHRYRVRCEDAGLSLSVKLGETPHLSVVDGPRLETVLSNVLSNAVKYTPKGGSVALELRSAGDDDRATRIVVTDSGPGIPAELQTRIFEKFFRVEHARPSATRKPPGAGLGLYLCKQIVDAHGGTIRVRTVSAKGGTEVDITLPSGALS